MSRLAGKTALVTGAASGLGRAMALAYLEAGARVALADVSKAALEPVSRELSRFGDRAFLLPVDLSDPDQVRQVPEAAISALGRVDILLNNAGIGSGAVRPDFLTNRVRYWEHDERHTRRFFEINAISPYLLSIWLVGPMMARGWGRIINVTTSLDTMIRPGMAGYGGSKASLEAHTAIMAGDLQGTGVTANVITPGGLANTQIIGESGFDRSKMIQPEAMVAPALWLASDDSNHVTGRRFLGAKWDPSLPDGVAAEQAGGPIAWSALWPEAGPVDALALHQAEK